MQSSTPLQPSDQASTLKPLIDRLLHKERSHAKILERLTVSNAFGPEVLQRLSDALDAGFRDCFILTEKF